MNRPALVVLVTLAWVGAALGHGDEDHEPPKAQIDPAPQAAGPKDAVAPAGSGSAQRLADGSVFLPKAAQRQLGLRTLVGKLGEHARAVELQGRIVPDPNAGGRVQASQAGRIEPGPKGMPVLGQQVAKGEILAFVRPVAGALERGGQRAQLADLEAQLDVARRRAQRLEQLEGSVPNKEIENARIAVVGLDKRRAAIAASLDNREALASPVAGVVSSVAAVNGQVVAASITLFEIIDPQRLLVEAVVYDPALATGLTNATATAAGGTLPLRFIGAGRTLREQALPVLFRIVPPLPALAVGQPLAVVAETALRRTGIAVPVEALVRNTAGEAIVWLHTAAEHFVPRRVRTEPLAAGRALVVDGLRDADRVVVHGAAALSQVR
jgi:hypothetical protein